MKSNSTFNESHFKHARIILTEKEVDKIQEQNFDLIYEIDKANNRSKVTRLLLACVPERINGLSVNKSIDKISNKQGVKRKFESGNLYSIVKNKKNSRTYVISTMYDGITGNNWIMFVSEQLSKEDPYIGSYDDSILLVDYDSYDDYIDVLKNHITAEFIFANKSLSSWSM